MKRHLLIWETNLKYKCLKAKFSRNYLDVSIMTCKVSLLHDYVVL